MKEDSFNWNKTVLSGWWHLSPHDVLLDEERQHVNVVVGAQSLSHHLIHAPFPVFDQGLWSGIAGRVEERLRGGRRRGIKNVFHEADETLDADCPMNRLRMLTREKNRI